MSVYNETMPNTQPLQGSIFGAALSTDLWNRLAGSPVLIPTTPSVASSLALDRGYDDVSMDVSIMDERDAPPMLDSVIHTHELPAHFLYAYFERDTEPAQIQTPSGSTVLNSFPVLPRVVCASRIVWRPVLGHDGTTGHRFDFVNEDGEIEAHAEVFVSSTQIQRVALVHRMFTPTARASGLVDQNSLLEFNSPVSHHERLVSFLSELPTGQFYLPINELAMGSQANLPVEIEPRHVLNPMSATAAVVWEHTRKQLSSISEVAVRAANQHNCSEFSRAGLS